MAHGTRAIGAAVARGTDSMTFWGALWETLKQVVILWAGIIALCVLVVLALSGCVALGALVTAYDVTTTAVSIGQRNQAQDTQEELIEEIKGMRADFRQAGWVKDPPLPTSEAARDRTVEAQANPARRSRSLWERLKRMTP